MNELHFQLMVTFHLNGPHTTVVVVVIKYGRRSVLRDDDFRHMAQSQF